MITRIPEGQVDIPGMLRNLTAKVNELVDEVNILTLMHEGRPSTVRELAERKLRMFYVNEG